MGRACRVIENIWWWHRDAPYWYMYPALLRLDSRSRIHIPVRGCAMAKIFCGGCGRVAVVKVLWLLADFQVVVFFGQVQGDGLGVLVWGETEVLVRDCYGFCVCE